MRKKGISKGVLLGIIIAIAVIIVFLMLQQTWSETGTSVIERIFGW